LKRALTTRFRAERREERSGEFLVKGQTLPEGEQRRGCLLTFKRGKKLLLFERNRPSWGEGNAQKGKQGAYGVQKRAKGGRCNVGGEREEDPSSWRGGGLHGSKTQRGCGITAGD